MNSTSTNFSAIGIKFVLKSLLRTNVQFFPGPKNRTKQGPLYIKKHGRPKKAPEENPKWDPNGIHKGSKRDPKGDPNITLIS